MKQFYVCPNCKKQIEPIVVTPNSISVLKFLKKVKSATESMIGKAVVKGYTRSAQVILDNLYRDKLVNVDFIEKKKVYKAIYYKNSKLGNLILRKVRK